MKNSYIKEMVILIIAVIVVILIMSNNKCGGGIEHYRDPIYLNRAKMINDWYPKSNGSIYDFPYEFGGNWSIFSGYPYYNNAY